ncbi:RNA-binding domain-containing protein [Pseudomonas alliivorans]|nr:RNA-binding domain-containing protein [Pseudomonas alliivorans]
MLSFSPFNKSVNDLDALDLAALTLVTEGWYVEYKQEVPKSESIAKSIAAMANSYGGWVFYGVKEESKENSVAGQFVGVDATLADASLQRIRHAVAGALSPDCHYEVKVIFGPCIEIGLEESKCIICIAIPQSIEAPHVHSKGVIYRRISDSSDPVAETDRYMIEKMFQRSKSTIDEFEKWVKLDPELSERESSWPCLKLMIVPNIRDAPRKEFALSVDVIKSALNKTEGRKACVPFETIYTFASGFVARQCASSDPTTASLTWKFYGDLSSEVIIPLQSVNESIAGLMDSFQSFEQGAEFVRLLEQNRVQSAKVVNLSILYTLIMGLVEAQREIFQQAGWPKSFHVKAKLLNVWRTIPFVDCEFYIDFLKRHGVPVSLTKQITSPPGFHPDTFALVKDFEDIASGSDLVMFQTAWCFMPIAEAFGIPLRHLLLERSPDNGEDTRTFILTQLSDAGTRIANS